MIGCASVWIRSAHRNHVLIHMIFMRTMQMAIMQIVDVAIVTNVAAAGSVLVTSGKFGRPESYPKVFSKFIRIPKVA